MKALSETGTAWWLSSEGVWLYGGWWNVLNGVAGLLNILCMTGWWGIYSSKKKDDMLWPDMAGISGIDIALWDIRGKVLNAPVYKLLGGKTNNKLRAYASQLQFGWRKLIEKDDSLTLLYDPKDYYDVVKDAMAEGYDSVKIDPVFAPTQQKGFGEVFGTQGNQIRGCYRDHGDLQHLVLRRIQPGGLKVQYDQIVHCFPRFPALALLYPSGPYRGNHWGKMGHFSVPFRPRLCYTVGNEKHMGKRPLHDEGV